MAQRSLRFRDRAMPPLQEAVWWCEYTIRHKGTAHLRSQAKDMGPLALLMWDILLIWLSVFAFIILALAYIVKKISGSKPKASPIYSNMMRIKKTE